MSPTNNDIDLEIINMDENELFELLDLIDYSEPDYLTDNDKKKAYCKNCDSSDKIAEDTTQGILVCIGCGTILSELFDETAEWNNYGNSDGKESFVRCGSTTNSFLPQSSLGTTIGCSNTNRIKILQSWNAMPYKERSLNIVLKDIQNKCRKGGILKCIEDDAKILYKNINESKHLYGKNKGKSAVTRGANRKSLVAACIFFACKRKGKTRSPKEIAKLCDLKYKIVTKGCKVFQKLIKQKFMQCDVKMSNPEHFIMRYCRDLHIPTNYIDQALKIAKNIQKLNIASMHTPFSVATGSILLIVETNDLDIERKDIAAKFEISEVTILKTYKKIEHYKAILGNDILTDKIVKLLEIERKKMEIPEKLKLMYEKIVMEETKDNGIDSEYLSEDEECDNKDMPSGHFNIMDIDNIDDYIDNINADLYDIFSITDDKYQRFMISCQAL